MLKRGAISVIFISCCLLFLNPVSAQSATAKIENKSTVPFRIHTSGKRITIQSKQNIQAIMVWTAAGHRVIEQKEINSNIYTFDITIAEKIFFVRVDMEDGKVFTRKIGVQ